MTHTPPLADPARPAAVPGPELAPDDNKLIAERRDKLRLTQSDFTIGCPLCFSVAPKPRPTGNAAGGQQP